MQRALLLLFWASHTIASEWHNSWDGEIRTLDKSFQVDPRDDRTTMRGSGTIRLGDGICRMTKSPRLYIEKENGDEGFGDVEFVAYGKFESFGELKSYSGLTLVARSEHGSYGDDGCNAAGYYARIYAETGEASFQKEYYHEYGGSTVYSSSRRTDLFSGGIPLDTWIGMKFKIFSTGDNNDQVRLELYVDATEGLDGGDWKLVHSLTDKKGEMMPSGGKNVPDECLIQDGDPVLRPGRNCFLRTDGSEQTVVYYKDASITELAPQNYLPAPKNGKNNADDSQAAEFWKSIFNA